MDWSRWRLLSLKIRPTNPNKNEWPFYLAYWLVPSICQIEKEREESQMRSYGLKSRLLNLKLRPNNCVWASSVPRKKYSRCSSSRERSGPTRWSICCKICLVQNLLVTNLWRFWIAFWLLYFYTNDAKPTWRCQRWYRSTDSGSKVFSVAGQENIRKSKPWKGCWHGRCSILPRDSILMFHVLQSMASRRLNCSKN